MSHIALYRSLRPQFFRDLVGQEHVTATLQNALREGRFSHAYLFSGPRGTGKTSAAKIMAKAVNCERGPAVEPCNECPACLRITEGSVMDVIELDAASNNGVDEIRDIRDKVKYAPTEVRRKVYIIDEVHMLSIGAANALLKTLEEPPAHVMFILATTEPHKLPVTIISRCQRYDFRRIGLEKQLAWLRRICEQENLQAEEAALAHIARLSDGGMRDALSLLDQIISYSGANITYDQVLEVTGGLPAEEFRAVAEAVRDRDAAAALQLVETMMAEGKQAERCLENLMQYFRDLLMLKLLREDAASHLKFADSGQYRDLAESFGKEEIFGMIGILNHYAAEMKYAAQPQLFFELALLKLCSRESGEEARSKPQPASAEGAAAGGADAVEQLQRQVAQLARVVEQLRHAPLAAGPAAAGAAGQAAPAPAAGAAPSTGSRATAPPRTSGSSAPPVPGAALGLSAKGRLEGFLQHRESPEFKGMLPKWSHVLQQVKDRKITVHAWLVDGEPVSWLEGRLLLAFKNSIHRETTDKPANKELIEQVMQEVYGKPVHLETMMLKDWNEALAAPTPQQPEELVLTAESEEAPAREEWIDEAIRLFGEDLVEIREE